MIRKTEYCYQLKINPAQNFLKKDPKIFFWSEVNNLGRDLGISYDAAELLGSRLKIKNWLSFEHQFHGKGTKRKNSLNFFFKNGNVSHICVPISQNCLKPS